MKLLQVLLLITGLVRNSRFMQLLWPKAVRQNVWSARLTTLFVLSAVLMLAGCTVCPPSTDRWSSDIGAEPAKAASENEDNAKPSQKSDENKQGEWLWQDGAEKWSYTGREIPHAPAAQWIYEPKSIVIRLQSDELLNNYLGQPHTIMVKVLQLTDVAALSEFKGSSFGLSDLMSEKATTLSSSILKETRITIGPDQAVSTLIDREQGARYIALVAGYFDSDAKNSVRVMAIPSVKPRILPCYDSAPWPFGDPPPPTPDDVPARLKMWLTLEASAIGGLSVTAQ